MTHGRLAIDLPASELVFARPSATLRGPASAREPSQSVRLLMHCARHHPNAGQQLRAVFSTVAGSAPPASFDRMAERIAAQVASGALHAYNVRPLPKSAPAAAPVRAVHPPPDAAIPFVDSDGKPVLDATMRQMQRPVGLDPQFFVDQGLSDQDSETVMLQNGGGTGVLGYEFAELAKFKQGGPWDAQRIGGRFHAEFVDYATVVIGLYAAASGMKADEILGIENFYALLRSHYPAGTLMDQTYRHLPARNVANTALGYELYTSRRIRPTGKTKAAR